MPQILSHDDTSHLPSWRQWRGSASGLSLTPTPNFTLFCLLVQLHLVLLPLVSRTLLLNRAAFPFWTCKASSWISSPCSFPSSSSPLCPLAIFFRGWRRRCSKDDVHGLGRPSPYSSFLRSELTSIMRGWALEQSFHLCLEPPQQFNL